MNLTSGLPVAAMSVGVDLVGQQLRRCARPTPRRLAHRHPHVGVEEVGAVAPPRGDVGRDGDPGARTAAASSSAIARTSADGQQRLGRGDADVHAEQRAGHEQGVGRVVAGVAR